MQEKLEKINLRCNFGMVLTPFCGVMSWFNDMAVDKEYLRDLQIVLESTDRWRRIFAVW